MRDAGRAIDPRRYRRTPTASPACNASVRHHRNARLRPDPRMPRNASVTDRGGCVLLVEQPMHPGTTLDEAGAGELWHQTCVTCWRYGIILAMSARASKVLNHAAGGGTLFALIGGIYVTGALTRRSDIVRRQGDATFTFR